MDTPISKLTRRQKFFALLSFPFTVIFHFFIGMLIGVYMVYEFVLDAMSIGPQWIQDIPIGIASSSDTIDNILDHIISFFFSKK